MRFEFDSEKSARNQEKHGIDFIDAQALWQDDRRVEIPAKTIGEIRMATIAQWRGDFWVAVWTPRTGAIRLISVRRARPGERKLYGEA